jgi:low temperature requirement protein LtrA/predicted GNAT family acetyltransferase
VANEMSIVQITPPRLRTAVNEGERSATWLELFYDLVFVVAVAVLVERLLDDMSGRGLASFVGYFALLWWLWASHTYYADRYDTDDLVYRLLAAGQMVSIVVLASSLSTDTAQSTKAFAFAYATSRVLLLVMYLRAHKHVEVTRALVSGYLKGFGLAAIVWMASAVVPEDARFVLWAVALFIDLATPWIMRTEQARAPLDVSHLPERFGLFTILVLGESMAAVVAGLSHISWALVPTLTAALGVGVVTGLWWLYFDNARGSVVRREASVPRTWRPTAWIYTHFGLAAGLAVTAAALEQAIVGAGQGPMPASDRWLLVGSIAAVFAALAMVQFASTEKESALGRNITIGRLAGTPFLLLIGFLSTLEAQWVVLGVFGVCVAQLVADVSSTQVEAAPAVDPPDREEARIEIRDDPGNRQYTVDVDGRPAGKAEYRLRGETYLFVHTEVDPEFRGLGVANRLAQFALDDVRAQGRTLVAICPFIAAFVKRHPEYDAIVDHELTERLQRPRDGDH